jgi:N-acetyl-anhydromuramyl-L-alanine amidase AmpD
MSNIIEIKSPNFDNRKPNTQPEFIIVHYTECDFDLSMYLLTDDRRINPVSAHYLVDEKGKVFQLVDEDKTAWHAGVSRWGDKDSLNTWSIGIELVNMGACKNFPPYPSVQIESVTRLCQDIKARHAILDRYVLGHSDIAPMRKYDPGPKFDWDFLAKNGVGLYPATEMIPVEKLNLLDTQKQLKQFGYDCPENGIMDEKTKAVMNAFHCHYVPAKHGQDYCEKTAQTICHLNDKVV